MHTLTIILFGVIVPAVLTVPVYYFLSRKARRDSGGGDVGGWDGFGGGSDGG